MGRGCGPKPGADWASLVGEAGPRLSERRRRRPRRIRLKRWQRCSRGRAREPTGPGRDEGRGGGSSAHTHTGGPKLGPAPPPAPTAPIPAGMMCLEMMRLGGGGRRRRKEEADAERRAGAGAQRGPAVAVAAGRGQQAPLGVATAGDEMQTLSGVNRPLPDPPAPQHSRLRSAVKGPGAQQQPASLGAGGGGRTAILSLGNVLNYLDRYTVAGERVPHPVREPGPSAWRYPRADPYIQAFSWGPKGLRLRYHWASDAPKTYWSILQDRLRTPRARGRESPPLE